MTSQQIHPPPFSPRMSCLQIVESSHTLKKLYLKETDATILQEVTTQQVLNRQQQFNVPLLGRFLADID